MTEQLSRVEQEALKVSNDPVLKRMLDEERVESKDVDVSLLWQLLSYLGPHKRDATLSVVLSLVESFLMTMPAYVLGMALDRATADTPRQPQLLDAPLDAVVHGLQAILPVDADRTGLVVTFGVLLFLVWLVRWALAMFTTYLMQRLGQQIVHDLRVDVYNHITSQGLDFFHKHPVGRLVNRTTFDVQSLSELFSDAFSQILRDLLFVSVLTVVMFSLDAPLALLLLASYPLLVGVAFGYRKLARPSLRTMSAVQSRMNGWLAENIAGMRENQLYRREERRRAEWFALTEAHQASIYRTVQAWGILRPGMMIVSGAATAAVLGVGYDRVISGIISVGVLITFLEYTTRLWVPIRNLTEKFNVIQTALTAGERVLDVLKTPTNMKDDPSANPQLNVQFGKIEFEDVRFRYPSTHDDVLRGISFVVQPGQMVGLVGDTGAGKSTVIQLLSRFYDCTGGAVKVDDHNVRDYTLRNLRSGIALVPQDVVIFAGTIRENVTLGAEYDDSQILAAMKAVCADVVLEKFEDGLDHIMEEGGRTLSAGERQLIAFARALLVNPPILILDEATASIDTRTESVIQEALRQLTQGRTTVVIAHRLSTIRDADQILVIKKGLIAERGNHDQLLAQNGLYAELHRRHTS